MRSTNRYLGALLILAAGALHLYEWDADSYRQVPVIGPLFLANFVVATLLGLALLAPLERAGGRGPLLPALAAAGAIGFALATIAGLEVSEVSSLFGFHEAGYRPVVSLSLGIEAAAAVVLTPFLVRVWRPRPG